MVPEEIHQGTWTHPATKQCHTIDFIIMRAAQRAYCRDVQAMQGASCWTDHRLVRAKLNIVVSQHKRKEKSPQPFAVHALANSKREHRDALDQHLQNAPHTTEATSEENWSILKSSIVNAAEKAIGRGRKKNPEWFEENFQTLVPLIECKNRAHRKVMQSNSTADQKKFRRCQRAVKQAVDKAREEWICRVAKEAEAAVKDGHTRWENIRALQQTHRGRRKVKPRNVLKEDGVLTQGTEELVIRWNQHIKNILNTHQRLEKEQLTVCPHYHHFWSWTNQQPSRNSQRL